MNHKGKTNNRNGKGIKQPEKKGNTSQQSQTKGNSALAVTDYIEEFTTMFPDYKQLTKEELIGIFAEYNNDFTAVVNSVINGTIRTKPPESWTDVAPKKKKKVQHTNQRTAKGRSDDNRTENRTQNRGPRNRQDQSRPTTNSSRPTRDPTANQTQPSQTISDSRSTQTVATVTRPAGAPSVVPTSTAPVTSAAPSTNTSHSTTVGAPPTTVSGTTPSQSSSATQPQTSATAPAPASTSSFARTTLTYANIAKSRQPWSPHSQPASAAPSSTSASSTLESEKKAVSGEETKPQTPVTQTAEPTPVQTKQTLAPESGHSQAVAPKQSQSASAPAEKEPVDHAPVRSNGSVPAKASPLESNKPRAGVILPGGFGNVDGSLQFQFGNLGISYEEELEQQSTPAETESLSSTGTAPSTTPSSNVNTSGVSGHQQKTTAPSIASQQQQTPSNLTAPVAPSSQSQQQQSSSALPHSVQQQQQQHPHQHSQPDYPENLSPIHGANEGENVIPHMSYVPNQFMHQPFPFDGTPDNSRPPVGHYFEHSYPTYPRGDAKYTGGRQSGNQNYVGRDSKNFNSQDSSNPASSQTAGQNPSAGPNQGYPYPSIYPYGPFMGQFPSAHYSTSQFHYQPTLRYYPKGFHNFGSYPSGSGMGYPEDDFSKGVYSSIPQQPGSYYMQPEITNPGTLNRDSKSQSNPQSGASKQQSSAGQQSGKPASPSFVPNPQDQGSQNPNSNAAPNFKASGNTSDAYSYPSGRDSPYGINSNFTQPYYIPPPAQPGYQSSNQRNY